MDKGDGTGAMPRDPPEIGATPRGGPSSDTGIVVAGHTVCRRTTISHPKFCISISKPSGGIAIHLKTNGGTNRHGEGLDVQNTKSCFRDFNYTV